MYRKIIHVTGPKLSFLYFPAQMCSTTNQAFFMYKSIEHVPDELFCVFLSLPGTSAHRKTGNTSVIDEAFDISAKKNAYKVHDQYQSDLSTVSIWAQP